MIPKIIAIVPCRADSRRIPGKNKKLLCNKELFRYSIEQAINCKFIEHIVITTDDEDILDLTLKHYGNEQRVIAWKRPEELCGDYSKSWEFVKDVGEGLFKDDLNDLLVIMLQPTSPLRLPIDIAECWDLWNFYEYPILTVSKTLTGWECNGAVYFDTYKNIIKNKGFEKETKLLYVMPFDRSIDIDLMDDWLKAEILMKERLRSKL